MFLPVSFLFLAWISAAAVSEDRGPHILGCIVGCIVAAVCTTTTLTEESRYGAVVVSGLATTLLISLFT